MSPPDAKIRLGHCDLLVVGTIAGFVPDAERVDAAFTRHNPDRVALGVPQEDLAALAMLAAAPDPKAMIGANQEMPRLKKRRFTDPGIGAAGLDSLPRPKQGELPSAEGTDEAPISGLDAASARFLELLARFGPTRLPSPDLEVAHRRARAAGVSLVAIDLDDATHADAFTERMKVRHIIRSNRRERAMMDQPFSEAQDAYALAMQWDAEQTRVKPLAEIERLRERHMAMRLRELAGSSARLLAIVPAARLPGILALLNDSGSP